MQDSCFFSDKPNSFFFPLTFEADGSRTNSTVEANPSCYTTYFWSPRSTLDSNFHQEVFPSPLITGISETASHYSYNTGCSSSFQFTPKRNQGCNPEKPARFPRRFQEALVSPSSDRTLHKSPETSEKVRDQERQPQHPHECSTDRDLGFCTPGVTQQLLFGFTASRQGGVRAAQKQQICQKPKLSTGAPNAPAHR